MTESNWKDHLRSSKTAFRVSQSVQLLASFESVQHSAGWRRLGSNWIPQLVFSRQQGRCTGENKGGVQDNR